MTERMTLVQARIAERDARQIDYDATALGLHSRSEAVREGLRLLHQRAEHANLAAEYGAFYGGAQAPVSDITAAGEHIAADTMLDDEHDF